MRAPLPDAHRPGHGCRPVYSPSKPAIILAVAVLGKAAGPLLIGRRLGFTSRETLALAALLNTRGLVELVVLNIGLESGILPPPLFTMLMLMALLTTAMTSPLLRRLGYSNTAASAAAERE